MSVPAMLCLCPLLKIAQDLNHARPGSCTRPAGPLPSPIYSPFPRGVIARAVSLSTFPVEISPDLVASRLAPQCI